MTTRYGTTNDVVSCLKNAPSREIHPASKRPAHSAA